MIQPSNMSHTFPMIRAGGLFILVMGAGVALGSIFSSQRKLLLALGAGVATVAIILSASTLSRPLGVPTNIQLWALAGAIVLEALLIAIVVARFRSAGERTFLLAILLVVGIHFLPMATAFGPLCAVLGATVIANASIGLWVIRDERLKYFWLMDGAIKVAFGSLMFFMVSNVSGA